jgi:phosphatidyl-myo-inositol alpha-mannosyltransferase
MRPSSRADITHRSFSGALAVADASRVTPAAPRPRAAAAGPSLRIALVTEYYYPHLGGVCEHVHFFAREARARGHTVDIITSMIPGAQPAPHVVRLGHSRSVYANGSQARITTGLGLRRAMRSALRDGGYDVVHVHSPLSPVLPVLAIDEADCPVVGTFHTYFDASVGYALARPYFQARLEQLAAAIAVSHSTTVALDRYFTAPWRIIPNGIDTRLFSPDAPRPAALRSDVPVILFLGRFDPRNGLRTIMDAFRQVRGRSRPAQLVVVGDGPLRRYYRALAGGDPDITFVGPVLDARPGYYANATVYACPTTKASFGITLLESMACGTPIVCTDIPGFRDVVRHRREALMVPPRSTGAFADALAAVLDDPSLGARLGETGRALAQRYSWSCVTDRVLEVYAEVLGVAAAPAA